MQLRKTGQSVSGMGMVAGQARCAGLLGAIVRDLAAVHYQPGDPRFQALLDRVMAVFDASRSAQIDIKVAIEAAEALGQAGDPRLTEPASQENWVQIPAGEFLMGAQQEDPSKPNHDPEAYGDESPVHRVKLGAYCIGRYPVTAMEYQRFVEVGGYENNAFWGQGGFDRWQMPEDWEGQVEHPNRPVVGVSWYEAAAYAAWAGCRLPTEAEWERAARGPDGRRYPWGNGDPDASLLNYEGKVGCPTPVGVYPRGATSDGIVDMAGNVLEWCSDWFGGDHYAESSASNPKGPSSGSARVLRGGAWDYIAWGCRCACRNCFDPDVLIGCIGFRVVRSWSGPGLQA